MSIFHRVLKFRLVVHSEQFWNNSNLNYLGPFDILIDHPSTLGSGIKAENIDEAIKNGQINSEWKNFKAWFVHNRDHLLFRGLHDYNRSSLKNLIVYGNDRYSDQLHSGWDGAICRKYHIEPKDFIWATKTSGGAWSQTKPSPGKKVLISVYDLRKMDELEANGVYALKKGFSSFKDVLVAVVFVYLKF